MKDKAKILAPPRRRIATSIRADIHRKWKALSAAQDQTKIQFLEWLISRAHLLLPLNNPNVAVINEVIDVTYSDDEASGVVTIPTALRRNAPKRYRVQYLLRADRVAILDELVEKYETTRVAMIEYLLERADVLIVSPDERGQAMAYAAALAIRATSRGVPAKGSSHVGA